VRSVLDYRRSPENKFPAQQDDVETAYRWLLVQGYRPEKIASGGHSVGGNLAVSLAIRLRDQSIAPPAAILSISAWYDTELPLVQFFRESWLGGTGVAHDDPRVNLLYADLAGLPPIKDRQRGKPRAVAQSHAAAVQRVGLDCIDNVARPPAPQQIRADPVNEPAQARDRHEPPGCDRDRAAQNAFQRARRTADDASP
jgi:alpha/beta hydrolase fold